MTHIADLQTAARAALMDKLADGVLVLDAEDRVVDANPAARQALGLPEGELPAEATLAHWPALAAAAADAETEIDLGAGPRRLEVHLHPLEAAGGRLLTWRDRTAEVEVRTAYEQLRKDLQEQSIRDPLTGAYNRRFMEETLARELIRARRDNIPLSLVMIDADHFKLLNETFGHKAGDRALMALSDRLLKSTRQSDTVCRYGGEEFVLIMPDSTAAQVLRRVDEWRRELSSNPLLEEWPAMRLTFSAGVAAFPEHAIESDDLLRAADRALFIAKSDGRNCVRLAA